jgi:hypothetical protein
MKSSWRLGLFCLLGAIAFFTLAPIDELDTSFGQMETPVAFSQPRLPATRVTRPPVASLHAFEGWGSFAQLQGNRAFRTEQNGHARPASDVQILLCVFLI